MLIQSQTLSLLSGDTVILRSAVAADAVSLCRHRRITSAETYFMARYPEECETDIGKIRARLLDMEVHPRNFAVSAFLAGELIGDMGVTQLRENLKYRHRAYMGISIQQRYCGMGLGGHMLAAAIEQAGENNFEQLEPGVFEDNLRAIHLCEKYGFKKCGVQPRAYKLKDGSYRDELIMVKIF